MRKNVTLLLFLACSFGCFSQNYLLLAEDEMNDDHPNFMDVLMVQYAIDQGIDSLWIKIESHYPQGADKGFVVAMDTDLVVSNGQALPQNNLYNGLPNNSMNYDLATYVNTTMMVPGTTFVDVYNHTGSLVTDVDVVVSFPSDHVAELRFPLSRITPNGMFNLLVGTGSFDIMPGGAGPSDIVPDTGYLSIPLALVPVPNLLSPSDGAVNVDYQSCLFNWNSVYGTQSYQIDYSLYPDWEIEHFSQVVADTFVFVSTLQGNVSYYWRVKAYDGMNWSAWSQVFSFTTLGNIGVENQSTNANIKIYPNPSHDKLAIEGLDCCPNKKVLLKIYNEQGQTMDARYLETVATKLKINLPDLPPGKYVVEIKYAHSKFLSRMIVVD